MADNSTIPDEIRERIISAINELYENNNRESFPKLQEVRDLAKCNMNFVSPVMQEWQRSQMKPSISVTETLPESLVEICMNGARAALIEAQELENKKLLSAEAGWEAERARFIAINDELALAYEGLVAEMEHYKVTAANNEQMYKDAFELEAANAKRLRSKLAKVKATAVLADELMADLRLARKQTGKACARIAWLEGQLEILEKQNQKLLVSIRP